MGGGSTDGRWRLAEQVEILAREWDGQLVLYHGGTGDTHLLDEYAALIYRVLSRGPADRDSLLAAMAPDSKEALPAAEQLSRLTRTLEALQRLNILEPSAS